MSAAPTTDRGDPLPAVNPPPTARGGGVWSRRSPSEEVAAAIRDRETARASPGEPLSRSGNACCQHWRSTFAILESNQPALVQAFRASQHLITNRQTAVSAWEVARRHRLRARNLIYSG